MVVSFCRRFGLPACSLCSSQPVSQLASKQASKSASEQPAQPTSQPATHSQPCTVCAKGGFLRTPRAEARATPRPPPPNRANGVRRPLGERALAAQGRRAPQGRAGRAGDASAHLRSWRPAGEAARPREPSWRAGGCVSCRAPRRNTQSGSNCLSLFWSAAPTLRWLARRPKSTTRSHTLGAPHWPTASPPPSPIHSPHCGPQNAQMLNNRAQDGSKGCQARRPADQLRKHIEGAQSTHERVRNSIRGAQTTAFGRRRGAAPDADFAVHTMFELSQSHPQHKLRSHADDNLCDSERKTRSLPEKIWPPERKLRPPDPDPKWSRRPINFLQTPRSSST